MADRDSKIPVGRMHPDLVAVFFGGTSGIGAATAHELTSYFKHPRIYIIGQSQLKGVTLIANLQRVNPDAELHFIQSDLTLLHNVDKVCRQIIDSEHKINLLFMTMGVLSMGGREETEEGLDRMYSLRYFARIRSVVNLLPQLQHAASAQQLSRVVSVLGAGQEGEIQEQDLALKTNYSLKACMGQTMCMMTLGLEHLARQNPGTDFIHTYPGPVRGTNIMNGMGKFVEIAFHIAMGVFAFLVPSAKESGKRHLRIATIRDTQCLDPIDKKDDGTQRLIRLNAQGHPCGPHPLLTSYLDGDMTKTIWSFTEEEFRRIYD